MPNLKRIVILGATGFFGNRLNAFLSKTLPTTETIGLGSQDIDLTKEESSKALASHFDQSTAVVMCSGIKSNYGNDQSTCIANIKMADTLCEALATQPVRKVIFFSSIAVYGVDANNTAITESTEPILDTHYGLSKFTSERLIDLAVEKIKDCDAIHVRTPTIIGAHEKIRAATPSGFLTTYLSGDEVTLWGDGSDRREFIFADDLCKLIERLLNSNFSGIINTSSGEGLTYRDSLDAIEQLLGKSLIVHSRERTKEKVDKVYSIERLRTLFPDFQFTPLKEALASILAEQTKT